MAVMCRTCKKPAGEVFGFCYSCGEPLCLRCLWKYPRTHAEERKAGVPGVFLRQSTLVQKLPRCIGCTNALIRARNQAKEDYWRDVFIGILAFMIPMVVIITIVLGPQVGGAATALSMAVSMFPCGLVPALILGLTVASVMRKSRMKKALTDLPLAYESMAFCPRCGLDARRDLFRTAKKAVREQKGLLDSLFGYSGAVPDYYECSKCRYSGPIIPVMGLYLYVRKYGKEGKKRLKGTVWEPLSESME